MASLTERPTTEESPDDLAGFRLSDFDYPLPQERIAQEPATERDQSRLLVLNRRSGEVIAHDRFANLGDYLRSGDLLVLNETRVNAMRLYGRLESGGRAEFLLTHRIQAGVWQCLVKPGKRLRQGAKVELDGGLVAEIIGIIDERGGRTVSFRLNGSDEGTDELIESIALTPLPPYIRAEDPSRFKERYQTVYAQNPGSSAAPTAGLHFTPDLLDGLLRKGIDSAKVTLHVGAGTFRPIESNDIRLHQMHEEAGEIPLETAQKVRSARGRIVAVGTTSVRVLESAAEGVRQVRPGPLRTGLYATPGYEFRVADAMVTNFHMPRSTLLVLVSAFAGREAILDAYSEALRRGYRFLSFGDSMLIIDPDQKGPGSEIAASV